jgi:cardiolipin synthase
MKEWQEEEIYHDGDHFFSDLCHAIDSAQKTIQLETYIFDHDSLGRRILNHLNRATRKGVKVSLLLDGFGCSHWSYLDLVAAGRKGLEARFYHPLPWQSPSHYFWRFLSWRRLLLGLWKLNRRNHRKSCLIDGEIAFLGGMNISERHLKSESGNEAWRDTSLRIKGHLITELEQAFNYAWTYSRRASFRWKKDQRPSSQA